MITNKEIAALETIINVAQEFFDDYTISSYQNQVNLAKEAIKKLKEIDNEELKSKSEYKLNRIICSECGRSYLGYKNNKEK